MTLSLTYEGFDYPAFYNGAYVDANSLGSLAATGANAITIGNDYGINAETSQVYADPNTTDSLADLSTTILQAERLGLSVTVRPLIDLVNETLDGTLTGTWRDTYEPYDPSAFFASYETMIVNVASIAQADGAQILDIGSELDQLTGPKYLSEWTHIISAVRAVYSGKLTYSATWDNDISPWINGSTPGSYTAAPAGTGNIATQISFWNQLDYIGIDEYAPISDAANPTLQQLINGWTQSPTDPTTDAVTGGKSLISYYENISSEIGKPLLFTEIGYQDAADSARNVITAQSTVQDQALQSSLYTAFFDAWEQSGDTALKGTFFWYWNPNTADEGPNNGITFSPQSLLAQQAITSAYSPAASVGTVPCYCAGTHLATPAGETRVEDLRPGDLVQTRSGAARRIVWIGERRYSGRARCNNTAILPIFISAGALAPNVPHRDLYVSPDHALLLDGVLIPARHLLNGRSIRQIASADEVHYFHVELASHDILLAEGAPAESYLDTGNRAGFSNLVPEIMEQPTAPKDWSAACADLVLAGPRLTRIKQLLFERGAETQPIVPNLTVTTTLSPDSPALSASRSPDGRWVYDLPVGLADVYLISTAFVPAHCVADSLDQRRLGVRLGGIAVNDVEQDFAAPIFGDGFYATELTAEGPCRWTNGSAVLALPRATRRLVLRLPDPVVPRKNSRDTRRRAPGVELLSIF